MLIVIKKNFLPSVIATQSREFLNHPASGKKLPRIGVSHIPDFAQPHELIRRKDESIWIMITTINSVSIIGLPSNHVD